MFWPVLTLISGRRRVSWEDNKELQSCRAVPYMIITFVSALAQKHQLTVACEMLDSRDHNALRKFWCVPGEVCMLGWAFLDFLLLGRLRWWEDESFCMQGTFGGLWAFLGILLLGNASLWYGLFAWVSSVYASRSFWVCCSTERHDVSGMYDFVEGNWRAKLGLDICSCSTQSRKCSSEETIRTSCAVYQWWVTRIALVRIFFKIKSNLFLWLKELNFFLQKKKNSQNWTFPLWPKELNLFFDMTQRIEYFFLKNNSRIEPFFCRRLKELNFFCSKWRLKVFFSRKMTQRIQLFFFWTWL